MVNLNKFNRLQNGTLSVVLTNWYLKLMKPVETLTTFGVPIKVLLDVKKTPLCLYYNELWKLIEEHLGFRSDYSYKNLSEAFIAVHGSKADIFLGPVVLLPWYDSPFRFLGPPTKTWYELSVKQLPLIESSKFYITVFPAGIWLLYLFILFGFPLIFWVLMQYIRKLITILEQSYTDYFVTTVGSLTLQGLQVEPKLNSMRMFGLVILVYGYLMTVSYSALLIAKLSVSVPSLPFRSLEELKDLPTYLVCVNSGSIGEQYFREEIMDINMTRFPEYKLPWVNRVNGPDCQHRHGLLVPDTLVNAMCSKKIVSVTISAPPMDFYTGSRSCTIYSLKQKYHQFFVSPIISKRLPYAKLISKRVLRLMECGLTRYLYSKQVNRKKSGQFQQNKQYINFSHVSGVFEAYLATAIGSFVLLLIEIFIFKFKSHFTY